jgi:RNA polymerase sigma-70 factor, ECF subfamily
MIRVSDPELLCASARMVAPTDAERLKEMLYGHFRIVWRTLRRLGLSSEAADDAAQQVFLIANDRLSEVEPGKERAFLLGTAFRVAANCRRHQKRRPQTAQGIDVEQEPHAGPNPEELVERKRWRELLDVVLGEMTLELRTVFVLFELEGLSSPEIAAALAIPLGTVASRLRRAREAFALAAGGLRDERAEKGDTDE